jgi:hypothetical protein
MTVFQYLTTYKALCLNLGHNDGRPHAEALSKELFPDTIEDPFHSGSNIEGLGSGSELLASGHPSMYHIPPGPPKWRVHSRLGSGWRHIKEVLTNRGSQRVTYVEGTVRQEDNLRYPQLIEAYMPIHHTYISPRMGSTNRDTYGAGSRRNTGSTYHDHAVNGLKYWYEDTKPMPHFSRYSMGASKTPLGLNRLSTAACAV